jgi:hypothetical protein
MRKWIEQTIFKRSTNGYCIHEEMFNILTHKENANANYTGIPYHLNQNDIIKKINNKCMWEFSEKRNPDTLPNALSAMLCPHRSTREALPHVALRYWGESHHCY